MRQINTHSIINNLMKFVPGFFHQLIE